MKRKGNNENNEEDDAKRQKSNDCDEIDIEQLIESEINNKSSTLDQAQRMLDLHRNFFSVAQQAKPSFKFKISFLSWCGVRCYDEEKPSFINFEELHSLNSLIGKNGSGKSTVLELLSVVLFNKLSSSSMSKKHMTHNLNSTQEGWIRCVLKMEKDETCYIIERSWSGKDNQTKVRLFKDEQDITCATLIETYKFLEENVIGSHALFKETVLAFQDRKSIVSIDRNECYELFCHIIHLDKLKLAEKENHSLLNTCKKNLATKNKERYKSSSLTSMQSEHLAKMEEQKKIQTEIENLKIDIQRITEQIETTQSIAFSCSFSTADVLNGIANTHATGISDKKETEKSLQEKLFQVNQLILECDDNDNDDNDDGDEKQDGNDEVIDKASYLQAFANYKKIIADELPLKKKLTEKQKLLASNYANIRDLDQFNRECSEFVNMYQKDYADQEISKKKLEAEWKAKQQKNDGFHFIWSPKCADCQSNKEKYTTDFEHQWNDLQEWFMTYRTLTKKWLILKEEHAKCLEKMELKNAIQQLLVQTETNKVAKLQFEALRKKIAPSQKRLRMQKCKLQDMIVTFQSHQKHLEWKSLLQKAEQATTAKNEIKKLKCQLNQNHEFLILKITKSTKLNGDVKLLEEQMRIVLEQQTVCELLERDILDHELYETIVNSKTGIPMKMMTLIVEKVSHLTNLILKDISSNFTIDIQYTKKGIEIFTDETIPVQQAGGYQKFLLDIIMRKVLCSLICSNIPSILFIDEGFERADNDHADTLCEEVLPKLATQFDKIVILSQFPKIHEYTTNHLQIEVPKFKKSNLVFGSIPNPKWIETCVIGKQQIQLKKPPPINITNEPFFKLIEDGAKLHCEICIKDFGLKNLAQHKKTQTHQNAIKDF